MAQIRPFLDHDDPFPHSIVFGEPGLGKTHLARYIAYERNEPFVELLAPAQPDTLPTNGIVLLDEVHRQRNPEPLFEQLAQSIPTIFAATTKAEAVDKAFRSRFFLELHFQPYTEESMRELIKSHIKGASKTALDIFASASAGNPRQALRLVEVSKRLETTDPEEVLQACQINADGLTSLHMKYLQTLHRMGKPTGASQLATVMYADETTIKGIERLLLENDLIKLTPTGRVITSRGTAYVKAL